MQPNQAQARRVLFFSAHPDDEIGSAGGFLIKTVRSGGSVKLVLGIDPGEERLDLTHAEERAMRLTEYSEAAKNLGAEWKFLDFPHYPVLSYETVLPCVAEIRAFKPDIVLCIQENDYHSEHSMMARIVKRAVWHAGRNAFPQTGTPHKVRELWEVEGDRPLHEPNHFENITDEIEEKRKLLMSYGSQQSRKDLVAAFEGINRFRGVMYKKGDYAEAYKKTEFFYG